MDQITLTLEDSNGLRCRARIDGVLEAINYVATEGQRKIVDVVGPLVDWLDEGEDPLPLIDRDAYARALKVAGIEPLIEL
jgi:hypothetical protein